MSRRTRWPSSLTLLGRDGLRLLLVVDDIIGDAHARGAAEQFRHGLDRVLPSGKAKRVRHKRRRKREIEKRESTWGGWYGHDRAKTWRSGERERERLEKRERERERERERDRETERHRDRETERQRQRDTETETETKIERESTTWGSWDGYDGARTWWSGAVRAAGGSAASAQQTTSPPPSVSDKERNKEKVGKVNEQQQRDKVW
jgi:hypothetical protein